MCLQQALARIPHDWSRGAEVCGMWPAVGGEPKLRRFHVLRYRFIRKISYRSSGAHPPLKSLAGAVGHATSTSIFHTLASFHTCRLQRTGKRRQAPYRSSPHNQHQALPLKISGQTGCSICNYARHLSLARQRTLFSIAVFLLFYLAPFPVFVRNIPLPNGCQY